MNNTLDPSNLYIRSNRNYISTYYNNYGQTEKRTDRRMDWHKGDIR